MSDMTAALLAASRLEDMVQDFLDARLAGQRDLKVIGSGVTLSVFRGDGLVTPWKTDWAYWGFAGGTVLAAFRVLEGMDVTYHRGFWMSPGHKQFNWLIQESKNS
jgi:hypothetical protein